MNDADGDSSDPATYSVNVKDEMCRLLEMVLLKWLRVTTLPGNFLTGRVRGGADGAVIISFDYIEMIPTLLPIQLRQSRLI
ncbi:hypothetical protein OH492_10545 [Vibrio chagasii]|nr:hypothetical protein [Vibrio chagasii]